MNPLDTSISTLLLGLVQGVTEFLPVSSSGHLALLQIFGGIENPTISYDIVLHVATMLATILFFFFDIVMLAREWLMGFFSAKYRNYHGWYIGWAVIAATIVTGIIGVLLKKYVEDSLRNSLTVGLGLLFTSAILIISKFISQGHGKINFSDGIAVGIAQGIAVFPGVSRSGMTIMVGTLIGLSREEAFRLSFLVSIPAILGATILQITEAGSLTQFVAQLPEYWYLGALIAFVSGLICLVLLKRLVINTKWWFFGIYCLLIGGATVVISFIGV